MKKITALLLTFVLVMACVGCGKDEDPSSGESSTGSVESSEGTEPVESGSESTEPVESGSESTESGEAGSEGVLTHEEYMAAAVDTEVVIEAYVQAKQSWWEDKATIYAQDEDGAYFLYNMVCSEEDYAKLTPGTKIRATGFKAEWAGEIEIMEGTFEILEGNYIAEAEDVTALLGSEDLIDLQNKFVAFKGMTVEASKDPDGNEVAFLYNYDGSGQEGGLHPGTENTPGACAFATAARELWEKRDENMAHYQALRDRLLCGLEKIPGACINSGRYSAPYIVNFSLPGIRSEVMIHYLEQQGISVSSGSACSKGAKSHVLTAMGLDPRRVDSAIRVSFSRYNTEADADRLAAAIAQAASRLRRTRTR